MGVFWRKKYNILNVVELKYKVALNGNTQQHLKTIKEICLVAFHRDIRSITINK